MTRTTPSAPAKDERDLSFLEVAAAAAKVLTHQQISQYNQQGYLKPFRVFGDANIQLNRAYFDYLLAKLFALNKGKDSYAINGFHSRCQGIYDLVKTPAILDLVEDIIGPNIICWGTHFFCKLPHDPKFVPWHQDASYWPLTPARTVTVWLAIDDADIENACMHVIPDTHRVGAIPWEQTRKDAVLGQEISNVEKFGTPVPIELKAGEIELHADMIVHGSRPNQSSRRRCGLTMRFCPPTVRCLNPEWARNAVLCRGIDLTGHWTCHPRPAGEEINPVDKPKSIGGN